MMNGLARSLREASFRAGRVLGICLLMSVGFVIYFTLLSGEAFTMQNLFYRMTEVMIFVGCMMFMIYGMVDFATYTQVSLSYGSTRKHALVSLIYMDLLQVAGMTFLVWLVAVLIPAQWQPLSARGAIGLALNVFLIACAVSLINGMLVYRFGKGAYVLFVIVTTAFSGCIMGMSDYLAQMDFVGMIVSGGDLAVLGMVGIILFAIAAVVCGVFMRKIEVRV